MTSPFLDWPTHAAPCFLAASGGDTNRLRTRDRAVTLRCMQDSRPIGVFDSGIGGLTVVKALRDLLPNEKILYLGDTARVPYGGEKGHTGGGYSPPMKGMFVGESGENNVICMHTAAGQ